jgi:hypothetical protein
MAISHRQQRSGKQWRRKKAKVIEAVANDIISNVAA